MNALPSAGRRDGLPCTLLNQKKLTPVILLVSLSFAPQNIDGLEVLGGVSESKVIECHGHFRSSSCISCHQPSSVSSTSASILSGQVPLCSLCGGYCKPDIVFFGEGLPPVFHENIVRDAAEADLVVVMGTSLRVNPVALIPTLVDDKVPRMLVNRELVGDFDTTEFNYRDVFMDGDCDESVDKLCKMMGWGEELWSIYHNMPIRKAASKKEEEAEVATLPPAPPTFGAMDEEVD